MSLKIVPVELKEANVFISQHHRHHKPVKGHRFSIGVTKENNLVGVAVVGRPVARRTNAKEVLEVTRLCTDGTKNACHGSDSVESANREIEFFFGPNSPL